MRRVPALTAFIPSLATALAVPLLAVAPAAQAVEVPPPADVVAIPGDLTDLQWGLGTVRAREAWAVSKGAGSVVAVIDTGADAANPDLAGQLVDGAEFIYDSDEQAWVAQEVPADESVDEYGHGTHVSGIIAAKDDSVGVVGVAPDARVLPVNVYTMLNEAASFAEIYAGLSAAVDYAASRAPSVISMSLGVTAVEEVSGMPLDQLTAEVVAGQEQLCAAVTRARDAGSLVVVSAGNDGIMYGGDGGASLPAVCPGAVSVAATGPAGKNATGWSSADPTVALSAPGEEILSTMPLSFEKWIGPNFPYAQMSGTSMSAPMVSGVAALLRAADPALAPDEVRDQLTSTATDMNQPGRDPATGFGMVDAAAAVGAAAARASVPAENYLPLMVRPAANYADYTATAAWTPALLERLPDTYTLTRVDALTGVVRDTATVAGNQVRTTWLAPKGSQEMVYLTANYADGTSTRATPSYVDARSQGGGGDQDLKGVSLALRGNTLTVSWPAQAAGEFTTARVQVWGPGVLGGQRTVVARQDGTMQSSVRVRLARANGNLDPRNSDLTAYVELEGPSGAYKWGEKRLLTRSPYALSAVEFLPSGKTNFLSLTGVMNDRFFDKHCGKNQCRGRVMSVQYKAWIPGRDGAADDGRWVRGVASIPTTNMPYGWPWASGSIALPAGVEKVRVRLGTSVRDDNGKARLLQGTPVWLWSAS